MTDQILTARKGPVLEITLNRPEIGNAASDAMAVELAKLLLSAGETSEIVVLRGAETVEIGMKHLHEAPQPPSELAPGLDPMLEASILKALSKRPEDRHASALELRADLLRFLMPIPTRR